MEQAVQRYLRTEEAAGSIEGHRSRFFLSVLVWAHAAPTDLRRRAYSDARRLRFALVILSPGAVHLRASLYPTANRFSIRNNTDFHSALRTQKYGSAAQTLLGDSGDFVARPGAESVLRTTILN